MSKAAPSTPRRSFAALLLLLLLPCAGCQWIQNEFFFLDKARPDAAGEESEVRPW